MANEPSAFFTNQVQPEPKFFAAASLNCFLNSSKEPNALLIASAILPVGAPPAFGAKQFQ